MKRTILFAAIAGLLVSCVRDIDVKEGQTEQGKDEVINQFDFSTVQDVNLSVDYSAFNAPAPVLFSVYSENPFTGSEESMTLRSDISPIFEAYTGKDGKFNDAVKLPAYAKQLYVVTGNFFVTDNLITVDVKNGTASAVETMLHKPPTEHRAEQARRLKVWIISTSCRMRSTYQQATRLTSRFTRNGTPH